MLFLIGNVNTKMSGIEDNIFKLKLLFLIGNVNTAWEAAGCPIFKNEKLLFLIGKVNTENKKREPKLEKNRCYSS